MQTWSITTGSKTVILDPVLNSPGCQRWRAQNTAQLCIRNLSDRKASHLAPSWLQILRLFCQILTNVSGEPATSTVYPDEGNSMFLLNSCNYTTSDHHPTYLNHQMLYQNYNKFNDKYTVLLNVRWITLHLEEGISNDWWSRSARVPSFLESPNKFGTQDAAMLISKLHHIDIGHVPRYTITHLEQISFHLQHWINHIIKQHQMNTGRLLKMKNQVFWDTTLCHWLSGIWHCMECSNLKTSQTTHPMTRHHISDNTNPQQNPSENLKSCMG